MKNIFKSRIFLVILTAFICITGTVYASELFASSISFTPSNPDWQLEENTVEAAINDLYNTKSNIEVIDHFFVLNTSSNLSKSNTYTVRRSGTIFINMNLHTGIPNVDSNSSYSVLKNNVSVSPTFVNSNDWNRELYYVIDVEKDDVISYSASTQKVGTANSLGIIEAFISR